MNYKWLLTVIILIGNSYADELSPVFSYGKDSDDISTLKYGLNFQMLNERLKFTFDNTKIRTDFEVGNFNYFETQYKIKLSESFLTFSGGLTSLEFNSKKSYKPSFSSKYNYENQITGLYFDGIVGYVPSYRFSSTRASVLEFLTMVYSQINISKYINVKHRISFRPSVNYFSSNNFKSRTDFDYMYGLLINETHWLWIGAGGENFRNSKPSENYWSPRNYNSQRLQLDYSYTLSKDILIGVGTNLSHFKENNVDGNGIYFATNATKKMNNSRFKIVSEYINSQAITNWNSLNTSFEFSQEF